eukprot:2780355-Prymnesium_polylepis.1
MGVDVCAREAGHGTVRAAAAASCGALWGATHRVQGIRCSISHELLASCSLAVHELLASRSLAVH